MFVEVEKTKKYMGIIYDIEEELKGTTKRDQPLSDEERIKLALAYLKGIKNRNCEGVSSICLNYRPASDNQATFVYAAVITVEASLL